MFSIAKLLPREDKFNRLLVTLTEAAEESARHLQDFIAAGDAAKRKEPEQKISAARTRSKTASTDVTRELCLSFITPFDREDISELSGHLYKITKTTSKVCDYLMAYERLNASDFAQQASIILREAELMTSTVRALTSGGKTALILEHAKQIDQLEGEGDDVRRRLLTELFSNTTDARELILKKDLYDLMERVIDRYRNAGEVALRMALKHA